MKLSKLFHVISVLAGFLGVLTLIGAWCASRNGAIWGMSETHLFNDAIVLVLVAVWLQVATMHHMMLEKNGEKI